MKELFSVDKIKKTFEKYGNDEYKINDSIHYGLIKRGMKYCDTTFERIYLDDKKTLWQDGVDRNGIPIIWKSMYEEEERDEFNDFGFRSTIGLTLYEIFDLIINESGEIFTDLPKEFKEFADEYRRFTKQWREELFHGPISLKDIRKGDLIWFGR